MKTFIAGIVLALIASTATAAPQIEFKGNDRITSTLSSQVSACNALIKDKMTEELNDRPLIMNKVTLNGTMRVINSQSEMMVLIDYKYSVAGQQLDAFCQTTMFNVHRAGVEMPGKLWGWEASMNWFDVPRNSK